MITFVLASREAPTLAAIRKQFESHQSFWVNNTTGVNRGVNGFGQRPPAASGSIAAEWNRITPALVDTEDIGRIPTDDWPFLYLRAPAIPALNLRNIVMIALISLGALYLFRPTAGVQPNWQMFFLGAGFMLLETTSVVHMALLFGSTWIVNSVVFFAILVMVLASNLFVLAVKPTKQWPCYVLLGATLLVNILVPMSSFLALPGSLKIVAACAVIFMPIFFAGVVFAISFRQSSKPDVDFGSNIAGAMLGGLAESLALVIGFNYLLAVALIFYGLSAALGSQAVAEWSELADVR
jgi:hypothetical protein